MVDNLNSNNQNQNKTAKFHFTWAEFFRPVVKIFKGLKKDLNKDKKLKVITSMTKDEMIQHDFDVERKKKLSKQKPKRKLIKKTVKTCSCKKK